MGLFSKRRPPTDSLNPFLVAEGFGYLVLEQLDKQGAESAIPVGDLRSTWAPVMAAITRAAEREGLHLPILERLRASAKTDAVRLAVEQEIASRNESLYEPILKSQSEFQSITNQVLSQCYESALRQGQRTGTVDASSTAKFAEIVLKTYISEKREPDASDEFFTEVISQAISRSVELLWDRILDYGIDNSQIYMKINSAVIATATILKYSK